MKEFESGRSMVEMLGTLAIIGVLSIGGIAGYSYGMDKHKANETLQEVRLKAIDILAQFNQRNGEGINIDSWEPKTSTGYTIGLEEGTIGIQIEEVEQRVCEFMSDGIENEAAVKINTVIYEDNNTPVACGEKNTMVFYFDEKGSEDGCNGPIVDDECQPCVGNLVWNDKYEMCLCEHDTEYLGDDGTCKTCPENARASDDGLECVCPEGYGWDPETNQCEDVSVCKEALIAAGFSEDNFTISGTTITYNKGMSILNDLDLSICNLIVNGSLTVSKKLWVKNLSVTHSDGDVIYVNKFSDFTTAQIVASGDITAFLTRDSGGNSKAIWVRYGALTAGGNIQATVENGGSSTTAIYVWYGSMKAGKDIVGILDSGSASVYARTGGTIEAGGNIIGKNGDYGIYSWEEGSSIVSNGYISGTSYYARDGEIKAPTIYYCSSKPSGVTGTLVQKCM